jgi:hypothetical protein
MTDVAMATTIHGQPRASAQSRLVLVEDPEHGTVAVRWRMTRNAWKCEVHGVMRRANCLHTFAAALLLADRLLGIKSAPTIERTETNG